MMTPGHERAGGGPAADAVCALRGVPADGLEALAAGGGACAVLARGLSEVFAGGKGAGAKHASRLTPTGEPVELAFVWPEGELRASVDPRPLGTPCERLLACVEEMRGGLDAGQRDVLRVVSGWQAEAHCRYGAWLGLRARAGSLHRKLYLEIPGGADWRGWEEATVGRPWALAGRGITATMVGLDPERGGVEIYYRVGRLFGLELDTLLRRVGLPARGAEVVREIEALTQRSVRFELPSDDMGFSYALDGAGRPLAFTWYSIAEALIGPAARIRERLLAVGQERGWDLGAYAALSAGDAGGRAFHTLVGAVAAATGPLRVTSAFTPAPERAP